MKVMKVGLNKWATFCSLVFVEKKVISNPVFPYVFPSDDEVVKFRQAATVFRVS